VPIIEKNKGGKKSRKSSMHGQATRSTARVEEELSRRAKKKSRGAL